MSEKQHHSGRNTSSRRQSGFTIVELLAVTMVMAILAAIVLGIAGYAGGRADHANATAQLQTLRNTLDEYQVKYGRVFLFTAGQTVDGPLTNVNINALRQLTEFIPEKTFENDMELRQYFEDPWGRSVHYRVSNRYTYEVWSWGPTGEAEGHDIIK